MDQVVYFLSNRQLSVEPMLQSLPKATPTSSLQDVRFLLEGSVPRTLAKLRARRSEVLVLDARGERGPAAESPAILLLEDLFGHHRIGSPVSRTHTFLVVDADASGAERAFHAGKYRIGDVLAIGSEEELPRRLTPLLERALSRRGTGKVALCLAGGGIEGMFYELGAMRALSTFLPDYSLCEVDLLCGISAGAILCAFLANGLSPAEIARGMQYGEGKLDRISRREIFDFNWKELGTRAAHLSLSVARGRHSPLSALFRLAPSGLLSGERLRQYLARQLAKPGMTDSFRDLKRPLYIGATDQDTTEHVVFGTTSHLDVPISTAARASAGLTPFYSPQKIDGRYYVDGSFTRTTNIRVAVASGATMIVLIDPLIPVVSEQPGFVSAKGAVFGAAQGLKAMINSRFDKALSTLREMYPEVSFHIFTPDGRSMKALSGSPMKYFYRKAIEELAFEETVREIRASRFAGLAHDFERHGVRFAEPEAKIDLAPRVRVA